MRTRLLAELVFIAVLILFPLLVFGENLETTAPGAENNPLAFVEMQSDIGLNKGYDVTVSPGGEHVYVAARNNNAVVVFGRDSLTGRLSYIETEKNGEGGVVGLNFAVDVALDSNGKNVYIAGQYGDAVVIFDRNPTTGALSYNHTIFDTDPGVDGLDGASAVTVSADGLYVYVTSSIDDAVAVFDRNPTTGVLSFKDAIFDTDSGVDGLDGATSMAWSPTGDHVYVASVDDNAVSTFRREPSGLLTFVGADKEGVGGIDDLEGASGVAVSQDGKHVYVASYDDDAVAIFDRDATSGQLSHLDTVWDTDVGVDGLDGAQSIVLSLDGNHVCVVGKVDSALTIFGRTASNGALTYVGRVQGYWGSDIGLFQIAAVGISPDGDHVYITDGDSIASFERNESSGRLTWLQTRTSANYLDGVVGIAVSPDGKHVYAAGYLDNAVTIFTRNPATGGLSWPGAYGPFTPWVDNFYGAIGVALDAAGENLYVAGYEDDALIVLSRDSSTGGLAFEEVFRDADVTVDGLDGVRAIAVSADGGRVYAASSADDAVAIFDRSLVDGTLTYRGMQQDGVSGVNGLNGAYSVIVSPGGEHVYVAGYDDDAVAHFDFHNDGLVYQSDDLWQDGTSLAQYLDGANGLAISPDGKHVYVASRLDDSVTVFARLQVSGNLNWVTDYRDGVGGVDGLNGARAVAISPDGSRVYVASQYDHALAIFERDATYGYLQFLGLHRDGVNGVDGLNTANGLAVSPEGGHVYVTGYGDDAVAVFARFKVYLPLVIR